MKWYRSFYFLIPLIIIGGFLNYNPQLLFGLTSYHHWGWQCALLASLFFIGLAKLRDNSKWKDLLGINFQIRDLYIFFFLTITLTFINYWLISYILSSKNNVFELSLVYYNRFNNFRGYPFHVVLSGYLYYIPQTFNEEIIIGALLLNSLKKRFGNFNDLLLSIIVAFLFCIMHQAMYRCSPIQSGELLSFVTLISLFLVGLIRNQLILRTGKITYSWAIHLSWNLIFLANTMLLSSGEVASQPRKFNLILGDNRVMILISIITFFVIFWYRIIYGVRLRYII